MPSCIMVRVTDAVDLLRFLSLCTMASLVTNTPTHQIDHNRAIMVRSSYQRDDWRRLRLNESVEDVLSMIMRFGFDINRFEVKSAAAHALCNKILAFTRITMRAIPSCGDWQELCEFTFDALCTPDAVPGSDATSVGTEEDLLAKFQDPDLGRAYALQDKSTEKLHFADHALSLSKACNRLNILDRFFTRHSPPHSIPLPLIRLFHKIRCTYKLRKYLLSQISHSGLFELDADVDQDLQYLLYLIQIKLRRSDFHADAVVDQTVPDWRAQAAVNRRPIYTGTGGHMLSYPSIDFSNIDLQSCCGGADQPTLEQLRFILLAALVGFNRFYTYDEIMVASQGLTHGGVTLRYTDRVGYRDIINSTDSFIHEMVGDPLLQAMVEVGQLFIDHFEKHQAVLVPPLPHPSSLVAQWYKNTTGREFPGPRE